MISVESVRKAVADDAGAMSETLADAFYDDPFFRWMLPDYDHRAQANREFFALVVDVLAAHDDGWTTHDGTTGAYERLGFRAIAEVAPAGGPTFWPMVRDPR